MSNQRDVTDMKTNKVIQGDCLVVMKDEIVKNVLQYIEERTMADSDTTWKDVKLRFGGDPTYFIEGYLSRPAHYQAYKELVNKNNRNYIGIEIAPEYIDIINKRLNL